MNWWFLILCWVRSELYTLQNYECCLQHNSTCLQIMLQNEWLITHITHVPMVSITCSCLFKWPCNLNNLLNTTRVWILSTMYTLMSVPTTLLPEWFITKITGVPLLPSMCALMYLHSTPLCEWFTAHITDVQSLSTTIKLSLLPLPHCLNDLLHTSQVQGCSPLYMPKRTLVYSGPCMPYYTHHRCTVALY